MEDENSTTIINNPLVLLDENHKTKDLFRNLIILLVSIGVFFSPIIVDYSSLPKGFELPKVFFWQILSLIIILGYFFFKVLTLVKQKIRLDKDHIILSFVLLSFLISSLLSPFQSITWFGNDFRYQGFLTHSLIILVCFIVYKCITKFNFHFLSLAFVFSSILQSIEGIHQFHIIILPDPNLYFDGFWVNGTFGQTNWFSGRLLMGIVFSIFYIGLIIKTRLKSQVIIFKIIDLLKILFFAIGISLMLISIAFSRSIWAMITIPLIFILTISYELLYYKVFSYFFRFLCVAIILIAFILLIFFYHDYNIRIEIWQNIWDILFQYNPPDKIVRILFGYGFDTLGKVFENFGKFKGGIVDRAHNFIFDILIQNGIVIFMPLFLILLELNYNLTNSLKKRAFGYCLIALTIWVFRSIVHESGIVNMLDFLIILGGTLGLAYKVSVKEI